MSNLFMRFPNGCNKALTLSYDDGLEQDIHLMAVLKPYGIKATFNLNSGLMPPEGTVFPPTRFDRVMPPRQAKAAYSGTPHEVAVHGNQHPFLDQLPQAQVTYDLLKDRLRLEALFDTTVNGMAYPYGKHTPAVTAAARAAGIVYSRTIENTHWYGLPENWLQWHPTCHHDDPDLMPLAEEFVLSEDARMTRRGCFICGGIRLSLTAIRTGRSSRTSAGRWAISPTSFMPPTRRSIPISRRIAVWSLIRR